MGSEGIWGGIRVRSCQVRKELQGGLIRLFRELFWFPFFRFQTIQEFIGWRIGLLGDLVILSTSSTRPARLLIPFFDVCLLSLWPFYFVRDMLCILGYFKSKTG